MQHSDFTRRRSRAFSLVESLVVLATVGLLIFVLIPAFEVYVLGQSPIKDETGPAEKKGPSKRSTYEIRFTPEEEEEAKKASEDTSEKMPSTPE